MGTLLFRSRFKRILNYRIRDVWPRSAAEPSGRSWALLEDEAFNNDGLTLTFSGRDHNGVFVDPGPVQLSIDLDCSDRMKGFGELEIYIVRLGVAAVDFVGADNVSLAYHKKELYLPGISELDGIPEYLKDRKTEDEPSDLDDALGQPRERVPHWEHPHIPPWRSGELGLGLGQHNFPAGYVAATPISMQVTFGESATSARTGQTVPASGPTACFGSPTDSGRSRWIEAKDDGIWSPGTTLQWNATSALPGTLGRHVESITWRYQAQLNGDWIDIPGSHTTTHPMYLLMGQSQVPDGRADEASPSVSWIGVLADLSDAITGLPSNDVEVVMDRLRETLHNDPWFVYNPGDAAYSDFDGPYIYWDEIWVEMTDWLDRTDGIDLYCHSVACVLSSQANHLGIDANYLTLGVGFTTHLTRAAGSTNWRRWSFNSHGITEMDGKVWDAAVDIDGDSDRITSR